jgi:hypothetical protein
MTTTRKILVDNATLSGVERITGASQTLNLSNINNDILCLEKLITAILFSDELIGIDDYKDQYRSSRLKEFDFVSFSKIDNATYATIAKESADFARSMLFSFDGSKPAGDVVSFFEALRIDPQLRWDVFVSSEYLTLSFLVSDSKATGYETAIDSAFRNESTDQDMVSSETDFRPTFSVERHPEINDVKDFIHAISSNNPNYRGLGSRDILHRLIFGYGWTAERSHFYNSIAAIKEADAFLSPLRDAFSESCCRLQSRSQVNSLLEQLKRTSQQTLASIVEPSGNAKFVMRLPFFTSYFISKADNPKQCIELALSHRHREEFQDCRTIFHNLAHLSQPDRYKEANRILMYIDQSCKSMMNKYAVTTGSGVPFSLSLGLSGLNISTSIKLGSLFRYYKNRHFSRIFRNMAVDMLNVERLGAMYDKICSSIHRHPKYTYSRIPTTPKFMEEKESSHGRPAQLESKTELPQ